MRHTFNISGIIDYSLREPELGDLATALVSDSCFWNRDRSDWLLVEPNMRDTVEALQRRRCVVIEEFHGRMYIALSEKALSGKLIRIWTLGNPIPALRTRPDISIENRTSYELLGMLTDLGWTWIVACAGNSLIELLSGLSGQERKACRSIRVLCQRILSIASDMRVSMGRLIGGRACEYENCVN